jgi:solute carrier family 35 protein F5
MLFFGLVGLVNLVAGAPVVAAAAAVAAARGHSAFPPRRLLAIALAKGLADNLLSDYLWARAVALVGPTVATVGLNVQVPLAAGLDAAVTRPRPAWTRTAGGAAATAVGAVAVVAGVCGVALAP